MTALGVLVSSRRKKAAAPTRGLLQGREALLQHLLLLQRRQAGLAKHPAPRLTGPEDQDENSRLRLRTLKQAAGMLTSVAVVMVLLFFCLFRKAQSDLEENDPSY